MTEINLLAYLGKSNSEVYRMKTGELALDVPKIEKSISIPSLSRLATALIMASFIALGIIYVTHYDGIEVSKRIMHNIMAENELDFSLEPPMPPPVIETPMKDPDIPEGFERFANIRFMEEAAPPPPLTKAQQAALEEARRKAEEARKQAALEAKRREEARRIEASKPKPPPPPAMYSLSFIELTGDELAAIRELAANEGAEIVNVFSQRTERYELWEVYRLSATSTLMIQGNTVELEGTLSSKEKALAFAKNIDGPTVVRRNIVTRDYFDVSVCCTTIEHARTIAVGSNVRDRVIKIVKKP